MPIDETKYSIPIDILGSLRGTQLFYPHSGNDLIVPIRTFAPYISDFWFIDLAYFGLDRPADEVASVLRHHKSYLLKKETIEGPPSAEIEYRYDRSKHPAERYPYLEPCVRTETYLHLASGEEFRVHRRRGYSVSGFEKEITELGVFFYRGDSSEGSNIPWLAVRNWHKRRKAKYRRRIEDSFLFRILNALINNGLIVTDGSRCEGEHNPYQEFRRFYFKDDVGAEAADLVEYFEDEYGRSFQCVGYAGQRYGPTLVWQVTKPETTS